MVYFFASRASVYTLLANQKFFWCLLVNYLPQTPTNRKEKFANSFRAALLRSFKKITAPRICFLEAVFLMWLFLFFRAVFGRNRLSKYGLNVCSMLQHFSVLFIRWMIIAFGGIASQNVAVFIGINSETVFFGIVTLNNSIGIVLTISRKRASVFQKLSITESQRIDTSRRSCRIS